MVTHFYADMTVVLDGCLWDSLERSPGLTPNLTIYDHFGSDRSLPHIWSCYRIIPANQFDLINPTSNPELTRSETCGDVGLRQRLKDGPFI